MWWLSQTVCRLPLILTEALAGPSQCVQLLVLSLTLCPDHTTFGEAAMWPTRGWWQSSAKALVALTAVAAVPNRAMAAMRGRRI